MHIFASMAFVLAGEARVASAATFEITPATPNWKATLQSLHAGDEVIVHAGTYSMSGFFQLTWNGTSAAPINVHGAAGENRPLLVSADLNQNLINLQGSYFTLRRFELTFASPTGASGVAIRVLSAAHATLEDLYVHDVPSDAITCNFPTGSYDDVTIRRNEVSNTGMASGLTGNALYVGCTNASCVFQSSVIEANYIHDLHWSGAGTSSGVEMKFGSGSNVIRDNVVVRAATVAVDVYGFNAALSPNLVERNYVQDTVNDYGIACAGQTVVRNNVVLGGSLGIGTPPNSQISANNTQIVNNTVVVPNGNCLRTNGWSTASGNVLANNAVYCEGGQAINFAGGSGSAVVSRNVVAGTSNATTGTSPGRSVVLDFPNAAAGDVYPSGTSPLIDNADPTRSPANDFNGNGRPVGHPDVGAYERSSAQNPGWVPGGGFKTLPSIAAVPGVPLLARLTLGGFLLLAGLALARNGRVSASRARNAAGGLA